MLGGTITMSFSKLSKTSWRLAFGLCLCSKALAVPLQSISLPPADRYASSLSGGKITQYSPSVTMPDDPCQKACLEACRELPVHYATARAAMVVFTMGGTKANWGYWRQRPVSALVTGGTVFIDLGQVSRVLEFGAGPSPRPAWGKPAMGVTINPCYENNRIDNVGSVTMLPKIKYALVGGHIALIANKDYALVGSKRIALQLPLYITTRKNAVITLHDFLDVVHETDRERKSFPFIQSAVVSYEPDATKLMRP